MSDGIDEKLALLLSQMEGLLSHQIPVWWLVGHETLKSAIEVFAVDPGIGSLLIYGERGTGKTSAALSVCKLMPDVPIYSGCERLCSPWDGVICDTCRNKPEKSVVNLSIRCIRAAMNYDTSYPDWNKIVSENLIRQASRGLIIFDPLNKFDPALVVRVCLSSRPPVPNGRGRVSVVGVYDILGDPLPNMFLSFTMGVRVEMCEDLEERTEIIQRIKEYTSNPPPEAELELKRVRQRINQARALLPRVEISDAMEKRMDAVCSRFVSQLKFRMDTAELKSQFLRVCRAYTAMLGKPYVSPAEVAESAKLMFTHRVDALGLSFPG